MKPFREVWKYTIELGCMNDDSKYLLPMNLDFGHMQQAAERLRGNVLVRPCARALTLSLIMGVEVFLKFENQQFTSASKERRALNKLLCISAIKRRQGVIAMSAGNHAQGIAFHAKRLGIPAVIVMPKHYMSWILQRKNCGGRQGGADKTTGVEQGFWRCTERPATGNLKRNSHEN
jgi:Pyridoxal-phosphate dependent enzyme